MDPLFSVMHKIGQTTVTHSYQDSLHTLRFHESCKYVSLSARTLLSAVPLVSLWGGVSVLKAQLLCGDYMCFVMLTLKPNWTNVWQSWVITIYCGGHRLVPLMDTVCGLPPVLERWSYGDPTPPAHDNILNVDLTIVPDLAELSNSCTLVILVGFLSFFGYPNTLVLIANWRDRPFEWKYHSWDYLPTFQDLSHIWRVHPNFPMFWVCLIWQLRGLLLCSNRSCVFWLSCLLQDPLDF